MRRLTFHFVKTFRRHTPAGWSREPAGTLFGIWIFRTRLGRLHFTSASHHNDPIASDSGKNYFCSLLCAVIRHLFSFPCFPIFWMLCCKFWCFVLFHNLMKIFFDFSTILAPVERTPNRHWLPSLASNHSQRSETFKPFNIKPGSTEDCRLRPS